MIQLFKKKWMQACTFYVLLTCFSPVSEAQTFPAGFSSSNIASGWTTPVGAAFNTDGKKLFVWEKSGKLYVCNWNISTGQYVKQSTPVLDISPEVGNWRDHGMLGFALDPNFESNGLIYVLYVVDRHYLINFGTGSYNAATNQYNAATIGRITRYKTITSGSNLLADLTTRTILLGETKSTGIPILHESHGIGSLAFASDGTLLASCGDAASYNTTDKGNLAETYFAQALTDGIIRANENVGAFRSQMINSHDGKILRIDPVTGNGVPSNPFYSAAAPRAASSRVWAMGFRNPFRFSIKPNTGSANPATGDIGEIFVGDVGWTAFEEFTVVRAPASNAGWPIFEGITSINSYAIAAATTYNKDEPNPLYGIGGCTQQFFSFNNLIKQATADNNHHVYNPCNGSTLISSTHDNRFFHRLPSLDWKHGTDSARVKKFNGNTVSVAQIGSASSGVSGAAFRGNCAVGGTWYTGDLFPVEYRNTYFMADYGGAWIKSCTMNYIDQVQTVTSFSTGWTAIGCIVQNPLDGSLVCVDIGTGLIKKVVFGGNQAPVVQMGSDKNSGPSALLVNFTGSNSYDPEGGPLTYSWNFGDGTALSTVADPVHNFTTANANPKMFVVKLTVKDNQNAVKTDSLIISVNNTAPVVQIISPVNNSFYTIGVDTAYSLQANVSDAEHNAGQLYYVWQTELRHNNHRHPEAMDTNKISTALISRIGCNGDDYSWFISLKVTDAAGLSKTDSVKLIPGCGGPLPLKLQAFSVSGKDQLNLLNWITAEELNLKNFEIERSYDGVHFEKIGTVEAKTSSASNNYLFEDKHFPDGYIYYRLKMLDIDGKFAYSFIVRIFSGKNPNSELTISPNPFKNEFLFAASFKEPGMISMRFTDSKGSQVKFMQKKVNSGFNTLNVDKLESLIPGIYILEVIQGNEIRKAKLIKAN